MGDKMAIQLKLKLRTLAVPTRYQVDPRTTFAQLCGERPHTLLLESAEINSKRSLRSLLLVDAALKLVCHGQHVDVTALSANGVVVLAQLHQYFQATAQQTSVTVTRIAETQLTLDFSPVDAAATGPPARPRSTPTGSACCRTSAAESRCDSGAPCR